MWGILVMSRIAKNSIKIDKEISCKFENGIFLAKGKLGEMNLRIDPLYTVDIQQEEIFIKPINVWLPLMNMEVEWFILI